MTTVTEQRSDRDPFTLTTIGVEGEDATCACPECNQPADGFEFSTTLGADMRGMLADFGDVGFCSLECVEAFAELNTLRVVDEDTLVFWDDLVVAEIERQGQVVARALGYEPAAALAAAQEELEELVALGDEIESLSISFREL
jgi:hypothetical protein